MTQHLLRGRTDSEVTWTHRRDFLQAAAAWTALGGFTAAHAQSRSNVVQLEGDALVNGSRLDRQQPLQAGDQIVTGPGSQLVFVVGNASFLVRQSSNLKIEGTAASTAIGVLRLITGAVASVWGTGTRRKIITPTLTAGIRGTGVYTEILPEFDGRSYFCNCYGTIDLAAGNAAVESKAEYHQAFWVEPPIKAGATLTPAKKLNHTDEEMEMLAKLIGQRTAWEISGRKGDPENPNYDY